MPFRDKDPKCEGCPAQTKGRSFVSWTGPSDATIAFLGQGPGHDEAWQGLPFVGPSGDKLERWLQRAGIQRHKCFVGNIVQCWMQTGDKDRPPTSSEVAHCRKAYWGPALAQLPNLKVIVPVGVPAMQEFLGPKAGAADAGVVQQVWTLNENAKQTGSVFVVPILHPAFIMRGAWAQEPIQVSYLKRVKEIAETGEWHAQSVTEAPPGALLYPTRDDIIEWDGELRVDAWPPGHCQGVTVDIEAAGPHITIIGLCRIKDLVPIVLRFRSCGGEVYDNFPSVLRWKVEWLDRLLRDLLIPKVFHNGQAYDICQLWRTGFEVVNYTFDTMLGMHIAYPELPKALEFVSNVFAGMGGWKKLAKADPEGEGK